MKIFIICNSNVGGRVNWGQRKKAVVRPPLKSSLFNFSSTNHPSIKIKAFRIYLLEQILCFCFC